MKKYFVSALAGLWVVPLAAQTTGMGANCDKCIQEVNCGAKIVFAEMEQYSCSEIIEKTQSGEYKTMIDGLIEKADATCGPKYNAGGGSPVGVRLAGDYVWDMCIKEGGISASELEEEKRRGSHAMRPYVVDYCWQTGFCERPVEGYYAHLCGLTPGEWGVNSYIDKCPAGGTSDAMCFDGLSCCHIKPGPFSDSAGSGEYEGGCVYQLDTLEEAINHTYCP